MGAGASANAADISLPIKEASHEDLSAFLTGVSAEERARLSAALGGAEASNDAPAEAAKEAEGEAAKEADAGAAKEGDGEAAKEAEGEAAKEVAEEVKEATGGESAAAAEEGGATDAPFLKEAFSLLTECFKDALLKGMSGEGVNAEELEKETDATMVKAKELMGKSFDHHDKSQNGRLEKVEAAAFFKHLLEEQGALMKNIVECGIKSSMDMMFTELKKAKDRSEEEKAEIYKAMKEGVEEAVADSKKHLEEALEAYKANKEERDAAAFKVVDTACDGTLSKTEFLEAFTFGSAKNQKVFEALGIPL